MLLAILVAAQASDRAALTQGVGPLSAPGSVPSPVVAMGKDAFVVLVSEGGRTPLFVAGRVGAGRAILAGHGAYFGKGTISEPNNSRFLANSLAWLSGRRRARVGIMGMPGIGSVAEELGAVPLFVTTETLEATLPSLDVLCLDQSALDRSPGLQEKVMAWVRAGHGLLSGGPAWGWQQLNAGKDFRKDLSINRMLLPYGLGLAEGTIEGRPTPEGADDPLLGTEGAIAALSKGGLPPNDEKRAEEAIERALGVLRVEAGLRETIRARAATEGGGNGPTVKAPVTRKMPFTRSLMRLQGEEMRLLAPEDVRMHPSAAAFPGEVSADAGRVSRAVPIDGRVAGWHATGLYAAPGEVVTVRVPPEATKAGLRVRIGAHSDELWHLDAWARFPAITGSWRIAATETRVASPFGGLIFLDVPEGHSLGAFDATILRGVPALTYQSGVTSAADWEAMKRTAKAPWADLAGRFVAITVPRESAAKVKDPAELMAFWDEMMRLCFAFYAAPPRDKPERYCTDVQIGGGYMHSGYPIMTFLDVADTFCDVEKLRGKGATWGFFHEMGHNFQESDWTFSGTGEVTNNLFALYASEKLNGVTPDTYGLAHPSMTREAQARSLAKYLADGAKFETWQDTPFLALTMYAQLREAFGWEPFTRLFAEYRTLKPSERPGSDEAKRDAWMVRFSRQVGKNLGPFFQAWGVPTSEAARRSIASLPAWMPPTWPKDVRAR